MKKFLAHFLLMLVGVTIVGGITYAFWPIGWWLGPAIIALGLSITAGIVWSIKQLV